MSLALAEFVRDFADALKAIDTKRSIHKDFRAGIGPFGEADAVRMALSELKISNPPRYCEARIKRLPDLLIPDEWAIEFKVVRPFGDNGKCAEHWSENLLHPYPGNTSSLGDCLKLLESKLPEKKAVVIFGFEHTPPVISLDAAIAGFELMASEIMHVYLGSRVEESRIDLVHPVHQQLRVFGYEVLGYR
jgi:hypothetical protein